MIILAFFQVILRNVFGTGILWIDPLLRQFVLWLCFLGASIATQKKKHININILGHFFSKRYKLASNLLINLFGAIITFTLAYASYKFVIDEISARTIIFTIGNVEILSWWSQVIIVVGFSLMTFRFMIEIIISLKELLLSQRV